jgi:putative addiction module CopG family antidote
MAETRSFALTAEQAAFIDAQVAAGKFASTDEVVQEALEGLRAHDEEIERWLIEEVLPTYEEMKAHPERGIPLDDVMHEIRSLHAKSDKGAA